MSQPTVFIGSSSEGLEVARAIGDGLECCAKPTVWDEDVFEFGRGFLEELLDELEMHDFAVLVLTPDDVTESRGTSGRSPRDNVLFECGLFMGRLGRERTFIVCDKATKTKIPSDLAGITFLTYDSSRMGDAPSSAVRGACMRINRIIKRPEFRQLAGDWKSRYLLPYNDSSPVIEEDVEVRPSRGKICIESKNNPKNDNYIAYGKLIMDKHFIGEWRSTRFTANSGGGFLLTIHPLGNIMYGLYVSPRADYKVAHGAWIMAKKGVADEDVNKLLDTGEQIFKATSESLLEINSARGKEPSLPADLIKIPAGLGDSSSN